MRGRGEGKREDIGIREKKGFEEESRREVREKTGKRRVKGQKENK